MRGLANRTFSVLLGVLIALTAISSVASAAEPDRISVQLKWVHDAQFTGFYVADQHGLYEAEDLSVELFAGGIAVDEIEAVASGECAFSVVDPSLLLRSREQGVPVVAIAVIYRIFPSVHFALAESGITKPTDFIGRRVLVNPSNFSLPAIQLVRSRKMEKIGSGQPSRIMVPGSQRT